jgi:hypothetical protein
VSGKVTTGEAAGTVARAARAGERGRVIAFPARFDRNGEAWEPWVDERTIARHFNASERTIRRWRTLGMPSRLFEGLRRYRVSECEAWHAGDGRVA